MYNNLPENIEEYISSFLKPTQRKQASVSHSSLSVHKKMIYHCILKIQEIFNRRRSNLFAILDLINYITCEDDDMFIQDDFKIITMKHEKQYITYTVDLISPTYWCIEMLYKEKSKEYYFKWNNDEQKLIKFILNQLVKDDVVVTKIQSPCPMKKKNSLISLKDLNRLIQYDIINC